MENKNDFKISESQNLHQNIQKRKRDDFDIFDENPIMKIGKEVDKQAFSERKTKKEIICDEESEKDFSTNVDERYKF